MPQVCFILMYLCFSALIRNLLKFNLKKMWNIRRLIRFYKIFPFIHPKICIRQMQLTKVVIIYIIYFNKLHSS